MRVMNVDNMQYSTNQRFSKKKNPSFGHRIFCDIGASFPGGTAKVAVANDAGKMIFAYATKLSKDVSGFLNGNEFIQKVHEVILEAHKAVRKMDPALFASRKDREQLSGVALFIPGITHRTDVISYLPNLRDKQGKSLKNIDFREYIERLKKNKTDINVDEGFKFVVTKDLNGTGLSIAQILKTRDKLKEGYFISPVLSGGGFGAVNLNILDGRVQILSGEPSNILAPNHKFKRMLAQMIRSGESPEKLLDYINKTTIYSKIGRQGTGVKDYVTVYFDALGHKELAPLAIKAGDAKIVNYNEMKVKDNPELAKQILTESKGFFSLKSEEDGVLTFEINSSMIDPQLMQKAKVEAADAYATGLAEYSILRINDMANRVILTGPFASGLDSYIRINPEVFRAKSLPDLVTRKIDSIIAEDDLPTIKNLKETSEVGFKVICSPDFNLKDNTYAGPLALRDGVHFTVNRGNSIMVPFDAI